jgi:predicted nucleotidyltransferase
MLPIVNQIAREYKAALLSLYGRELAALILFGSHARGDYHDESDIDFAVVLNSAAGDGMDPIFETSEASAQLGSKYGYAISTLPVSVSKLQHSAQGVYREIRKEGIVI